MPLRIILDAQTYNMIHVLDKLFDDEMKDNDNSD